MMSHRLLILASLFTAACSGGASTIDAPRDGGTAVTVRDGGPRDAGGVEPADAGTVDAGDRFDDARPLGRDFDNAIVDQIRVPGQRNLYVLEGNEGEYLRIFANPDIGGSDATARFALRIYDASRRPIAEGTYPFPDIATWSYALVLIRLPATGRYYVEVLERNDFLGGAPLASVEHIYRLYVIPQQPALIDPELGNDIASANLVTDGERIQRWCGALDGPDDVDVYRLDAWPTNLQPGLWFAEPTATGNGSTLSSWDVRITSATATVTYARRVMTDDFVLVPRTGAGEELLVWISRDAVGQGDNDFYCFATTPYGRPTDVDVEPNDTPEDASRLVLEPDGADPDVASLYFTTRLGDDDVDYVAFDSTPDHTASLGCAAEAAGSGVRGLHVALGAFGATETSTGAAVVGVTVTSTRTIIRISKSGQAPDVDGDYVSCFLETAPP